MSQRKKIKKNTQGLEVRKRAKKTQKKNPGFRV
jgi:hypothetical protein